MQDVRSGYFYPWRSGQGPREVTGVSEGRWGSTSQTWKRGTLQAERTLVSRDRDGSCYTWETMGACGHRSAANLTRWGGYGERFV